MVMPTLHPHPNPSSNVVSFTVSDVRDLHELDIDDINVMNGVCRAMQLHVMTEWYTRKNDRWCVSRSDAVAEIFTGTWVELRAWVRGYATAWVRGVDREERWKRKLMLFMTEGGV